MNNTFDWSAAIFSTIAAAYILAGAESIGEDLTFFADFFEFPAKSYYIML